MSSARQGAADMHLVLLDKLSYSAQRRRQSGYADIVAL